MTKEEPQETDMIKKVVDFLMFKGYTIFGGYVRDSLIGEIPKDIDLYIPVSESHPNESIGLIVSRLSQLGQVTILGYDDCVKYQAKVLKTEVLGVKVDCVFVEGDWQRRPDCDINLLTLSETGLGTLSSCKSVFTILQKLFKKEFVVELGADSERVQKLLDRGYTDVTVYPKGYKEIYKN